MSEQFTLTTSDGHTVQFTTQNVSDETRRLIGGTLAGLQAKAAAYDAGERVVYDFGVMWIESGDEWEEWKGDNQTAYRIVREAE